MLYGKKSDVEKGKCRVIMIYEGEDGSREERCRYCVDKMIADEEKGRVPEMVCFRHSALKWRRYGTILHPVSFKYCPSLTVIYFEPSKLSFEIIESSTW